jgi:chlorophyll/bacteriochlorophyll a synthase
MTTRAAAAVSTLPSPLAVLELLKPVTWFAPMWAFMCGIVSSGVSLEASWGFALAGMVLAGPLVCATSQAINDWYDRHVDAINEPGRPIPSGRVPGRWGLWIALAWCGLSLAAAWGLGPWVFGGTFVGLILAFAYSAPPLRLKQSGWLGPLAVGISYEGLAWFAGAAAMAQALPDPKVLILCVLYSLGAHGIMTLNDFKAIEGDARMGVRSLPVQLGPERAGLVACVVMIVPQLIVIAMLVAWGAPLHAAGVAALVVAQIGFMTRLLKDPKGLAPWYNGTGILGFVLGMLVSAFAVGAMTGGAG